jgi:hypothetical protein
VTLNLHPDRLIGDRRILLKLADDGVEWHRGFRLTVEQLRRHPDYRGPEYVKLGTEIAVDGLLDRPA